VRIAGFIAITCCCLGLSSLFMPTGQLLVKQPLATHRVERSLYQLGKSTSAVRRFLDAYRSSRVKKVGAKALDKVAPHLPGGLRSRAGDVQEAIAILDGLRDDDIDTAGKVMATTLWTLLTLQVLLILLLQGTDVGTGRLRVAAAVVSAVAVAAIAVGVHLALREIVAAANVELEREVFTLRNGAYLLPAAGLGAAVATIGFAISHTIARRRLARQALPPVASAA
jgi:hypothetical protein